MKTTRTVTLAGDKWTRLASTATEALLQFSGPGIVNLGDTAPSNFNETGFYFNSGEIVEVGSLGELGGGVWVRSTGPQGSVTYAISEYGTAVEVPDEEVPDGVVWNNPTPGVTGEVITRRSEMQVAPEGMYFIPTNLQGFDTPAPAEGDTYDRQYHELVYLWDYDDPGARWTAPENVQEHQRNANVGYGPRGAHVYETPGTYNPSVIVFEPSSGKLAKIEFGPFTVKDPDVFFAGDKTRYVSPNGNFDTIPDGALPYTDLLQAIADSGTMDFQRIVLAKDQTSNMGGWYNFDGVNGRNWRNLAFYGEKGGARHVMYGARFNMIEKLRRVTPGDGCDLLLTGFDMQGEWNDIDETGNAYSGVSLNGGDLNRRVSHFCMHDMKMSGYYQAVFYNAGDIPGIISNTVIENWQDYAVYSGTDYYALLGCRFMRRQNAASGGYKNGMHNQHGVLRTNNVVSAVIDGCDFFNNAGWWVNNSPYHTQQPVIRWNFMGHEDNYAMALNMQRCSLEGGEKLVAFQHMNTGDSVDSQNAIVERNMFVGSFMTSYMIMSAFGGITARNNVFIFANAQRFLDFDSGLFSPSAFFGFDSSGLVTGDEIDPIIFYNNTCVNLLEPSRTYANWSGRASIFEQNLNNGKTPLANGIFTERNNILHQPNIATPEVEFAPLDTTPIWQARTLGYKDSGGGSLTFTQAVPAGGTFEIPYTLDTDPMIDLSTLTAADFAGGEHEMRLKSPDKTLSEGAFSLSFGENSVTVTNLTGAQIETTFVDNGQTKDNFIEFRLDRSQGPRPRQMDTQFATPVNSVALYTPLSGSSAIRAVSSDVALDYRGTKRPDPASIGANEPE